MSHSETVAGRLADPRLQQLLALLVAVPVATVFALINIDAVFTPAGVVPVGNDSFYHGARILDAIAGDSGLLQFDPSIHVPEGSWISWPWAYDYFMSRLAVLVLTLNPAADPMSVLVFVPVAWLLINMALLSAICRQLELRFEFQLLVLLGFALLPTTQTQHGIGQIDHHFIELFFVLLATWSAIRWISNSDNTRAGFVCGASLGVSMAFHHGLFILQLPLLIAVFLLWLRGLTPARHGMGALAAGLLVSVILVSLPAATVHDMQFNMTSLSWFHLYIALCSAVVLIFLAMVARSVKTLVILGVAGLAALLPITAQLTRGADFLSGRMLMLDRILEMKSPYAMITGDFGLAATTSAYSLLILLVPLMIGFVAWRLVLEKSSHRVAYLAYALVGMILMLMQYRLNYFGSAFMLTVPFFALSSLEVARQAKRGVVAALCLLVFLVAFRPPLTGALFNKYPAGGNVLYVTVQPLLPALESACRDDPGIVLAASQFGHYIRYHTDCSVIANNFLIEELHFQKVEEVNYLFGVPAEVLASGGGGIRYVLVMATETHKIVEGKAVLKSAEEIRAGNPRLVNDLLYSESIPDSVEILQAVDVDMEDQSAIPVARVLRLNDP